MEFYPKADTKKNINKKFQFPAGWNSTRSGASPSEFVGGFNSQRDGILRCDRRFRALKWLVSIPNGMEFYKSHLWSAFYLFRVSIPNGMEFYWAISDGTLLKTCFNSQRDGILQHRQLLAGRIPAFQFPTGWNSTEIKERVKGLKKKCFNSQRDGILLCFFFDCFEFFKSFNSQRDGILQHEFCHFSGRKR